MKREIGALALLGVLIAGSVWNIRKADRLTGEIREHIEISEQAVIDPKQGRYGVDIPKNTWHTVECLEPDTVVFEVKEGPFVPHEIDGVLEVKK